MAGLAVRFTVIFLLFAFSQARFIHEHDVTPEETVNELPESDPNTATAILLPSEKPGFEPAKVVDFQHHDASETDSNVDSVPLTMISFRPVKRHFPSRPMIPFRHKHNCRFHKRFMPFKPRFQQKRYTISYGNDMILADERSNRFDPEKSGIVRQIQARWARFPDDVTESKEAVDFIKPHRHDHDLDEDHHHHHHDHEHGLDEDHHRHEHEHDLDEDRHHQEHEHDHDHDDLHHHHHHHRRRHHHREEEDEDDEREKHEHEGGLMEGFRKFFYLF